ncbi:MAG: methyltransferase domain-containing protein [Pseudomonadota bacterium]
MRQDSITIERFYNGRLGVAAGRVLSGRIVDLWQDLTGLSLLGLGHPFPALDPFTAQAKRTVAALGEDAGQVRWDAADRGNCVVVSPESRLPFTDGVFDRAILLHAMEDAASPRALCRELWRVMAPEGRIVVAAANRRGLWARAERTPFGHGRPWTLRQLSSLLGDSLFQVTASTHALYMPPINVSVITGGADGWERAGRMVMPGLGGVVLVEAVKRLYIEPGGGAVAPAVVAAQTRKTAGAMTSNLSEAATDTAEDTP